MSPFVGESICALLALLAIAPPVAESVQCGISPVTSNFRIVGGETAQPNQFPWMAYLETQYVPIGEGLEEVYSNCDGTLIDNQWILSAAHCFIPQEGYKLNRISVVLGAHNLTNHSELRTVIFAKKVFRHTKYVQGDIKSKYDIAMVQLSHTIDLSTATHIAPICMPSDGQTVSKTECSALGWGKTSTYGTSSTVLKVVNLNMYSSYECAQKLHEVNELQVCAGYQNHGTCKGDGGGPLQCKGSDGSFIIEGITSYGSGSCGSGSPDVYTNVEKFLPWIKEIKLAG